MKKKTFLNVLRGVAVLTLTAGCLVLSACGDETEKDPVPSEPLTVTITGTISHTDYTPGQSGTIIFNRFPASVAEFKQVREQIGREPHGAAALQLMAYEMYRRNKKRGEECIRLNNVTNNITIPISRLNELFYTNSGDPGYQRPYQIAAFLKGATPENGYNPQKPYTIEVRVNPVQNYVYSNDYQANVLYLQVLTKGKDRGEEGVEVIKTHRPGEPSNGDYYIVFKSPGLYSSVKGVSFTTPFNGLD